MTRPCKCGLGWRPRRLFGFAVEPVDGAPCFFSGLLTLGGCGLPSAGKLADCFVAGNGKIQGGWLQPAWDEELVERLAVDRKRCTETLV